MEKEAFIKKYCKEKGWDYNKLTVNQYLEIANLLKTKSI